MPLSESCRIFISYAHRDGAPLAQYLQAELTESGFDAWLDTHRLYAGDAWSREIEEAIDRAAVVLALLSAGSFTSDICRAEQRRALEKGKRVVPLRVQTDCDVPLYLQTRQWLDFSNPALYPEQLPKLIESIEKRAGVTVSAELLIRYNNAPSLLENFVSRTELMEALRNALFTEGANRNIALTAMQGMGGIGKTVLARALCHDEVVQQAFPDGIFWLEIGRESQLDFSSRIKDVPGLNRLLGQYEGEAACRSQYRDVLRTRAALIVVDDVWRASDIEPFMVESPRSRLLITTRDTSIGACFGAREFTANLLTEDESRQVLAKWSGRPLGELPPQAREVIRECGYLPLALAMIGAQLKGKPPILWNAALDHLRKADLKEIKAQFPEPNTTLFRAIQLSVEALDETPRKRYVALAALLEDMPAAVPVQQCLWGVDEAEAVETAEQFVSLSLAQREGTEGSIRLHDLQLDYVRAQYPDKEALELICGATRLSSRVIARDPGQFASQMVGRLLPYKNKTTIDFFTAEIVKGIHAPWLRPLRPTLHASGTPLVRSLEGHEDEVNGVALSADGHIAVSASADKTLKVWDLASGRELLTLTGHTSVVNAVAVTGDGKRAVSASLDKTLKVWDLANGRELRTLTGHASYVTAVAVTADGQRAVSASGDETLKVWDLDSGRELLTLAGHSNLVWAVAVTPDGDRAVSASADRTLKVWDLASGRELRTLTGHTSDVNAIAVTLDGRRAVSASDDDTLKVWNLDSGRELRTLTGHLSWVKGAAVTRDGERAISASWDQTLRVWDLASGRELRVLTGHTDPVLAVAVAVTGDGERAVSASQDHTLKVWDLAGGRKPRNPIGHTSFVSAVAVTSDGRRAVSVSMDRTLKVWDLASGRKLRTLTHDSVSFCGVAVTPDGQRAVLASSDQTLKVWDLASGRKLRTLNGHTSWVWAVTVTPDGQRAVSASNDGTLKVWDLASARELLTLAGHTSDVWAVAVTPDGTRAVSASGDHTLKVWELGSERELRTLWGENLKVWEPGEGHVLCTLTGHAGSVHGVALSGDGRIAVSASSDMTLKVWELGGEHEFHTLWGENLKVWEPGEGHVLRTLIGHADRVNGVAVTQDGQRAVSASFDNTLKVWDLETGQALATFTCDSPAYCCAFANGGRLIVAGDGGGRVHFLRLEEPKPKS